MSDRHPKWQRVEPGHVIPAGQPYRVEYTKDNYDPDKVEYKGRLSPFRLRDIHFEDADYYVDSSWRPPLVLPDLRTLVVRTEDQMYDLLTGLNVSGLHCELAAVSVWNVGTAERPNIGASPFVATLTDPDADHVNYVYASESGESRCVIECDNCGSTGRDDWKPTYPVTVMVAVLPDAQRCRDDEIDTWWLTEEQIARIEAAR